MGNVSSRRPARSRVELERTNRALQAQVAAHRALREARDERALFDALCAAVVRDGGYPRAWVALRDRAGAITCCACAGADGAGAWGGGSPEAAIAAVVLRTAAPCIEPAVPRAAAPSSQAAFPLRSAEGPFGVFAVHADESGAFVSQELAAFADLADDAARVCETMHAPGCERECRTLGENTPDLIVRWDHEMRRVYANPAFARMIGVPTAELLGTRLGSRYPPELESKRRSAIAVIAESVRACFATGAPALIEFAWPMKEGTLVHSMRLIPEPAGGEIASVLGIGRDVTALKEIERQLRALAENAPDVIARFDREGRWLYANEASERLGGVPVTERIGQRFADIAAAHGWPGTLRDVGDWIVRVAATGESMRREVHFMAPAGESVFDMRLVPEVDDDGDVTTVLAVARDMTDQVRAAEALRASEARFRQVTESIDEVFWLTDAESWAIIYVSPAYERTFGRSCASLYAESRSWLELVHPDDRERVVELRAHQPNAETEIEYRIVRHNDVRWIHARSFPIRDAHGTTYRIAGIAEDVTVRRKLEEQLHQAQKMEAVGQLAGGIAHDFNNVLAVIQMQASLVSEDRSASAQMREGMREIQNATERAANLTRQLLTFSRRQLPRPEDLDVGEVIGNVTKLLRRLLGEDVALETNFASDLPLVHADPGMLEQVLMNLAINARDAMPNGGRLSVSLDAVEVTADAAAARARAATGRFVRMTVSDNGCGICHEVLPRIFEPFFTTKEVGRGTGLGLATAFGIVQEHGGWIEVESAVGRGTTFQVFLPVLSRLTSIAPPPPPLPVRGGNETILLVEDDPGVRGSTRAALERYGYRVVESDTAASAMLAWDRLGRVDLLLTDLVMPGGTSGRGLADLLSTRQPSLRVIYTTGYSPDLVNRLLDLDRGRILLQKPFGPDELAASVRRCLEDGPRCGAT
jgi:two-component system, cell cycle sensor histidine kinase and response regulator CckA